MNILSTRKGLAGRSVAAELFLDAPYKNPYPDSILA